MRRRAASSCGLGRQRIGARRDDRRAGRLLVDLDAPIEAVGRACRSRGSSTSTARRALRLDLRHARRARRLLDRVRSRSGSRRAASLVARRGSRVGATRSSRSSTSPARPSRSRGARSARTRSSSTLRARARTRALGPLGAARARVALELGAGCDRARPRARASSARRRSSSRAASCERAASSASLRALLEVAREPARAEHDREVLRVRRDRRAVVAQPLEQRDPLVELAMAMRLAEHEHHQLGRRVVIDDRHRDADRRRSSTRTTLSARAGSSRAGARRARGR